MVTDLAFPPRLAMGADRLDRRVALFLKAFLLLPGAHILPRREAHARAALAQRPISPARSVSPVGVGLLERCVRFELPEHRVANLALANGVFRQHRGDDFRLSGISVG
jgi:hypothetical protein